MERRAGRFAGKLLLPLILAALTGTQTADNGGEPKNLLSNGRKSLVKESASGGRGAL
jgi:hypothetical protein